MRKEKEWDNDEVEFGTTSSYGKNQFSVREIVIFHIRKISELSCHEFTPSFWEKRPMKIGDGVAMAEIYHPDKREAYINAVDFLLDVVMNHVQTTKVFKNTYQALLEKEESELETFKNSKKSDDEWVLEKQKLRRKLFGAIMINLNSTGFFEGTSHGESPA